VIAHGMLTMGLASRAVAAWTGGAPIVDLGVRFTSMVVVPDTDEGTTVTIGGTVKSVEDGRVKIALQVTCDGQKVLGNPTAVVRA